MLTEFDEILSVDPQGSLTKKLVVRYCQPKNVFKANDGGNATTEIGQPSFMQSGDACYNSHGCEHEDSEDDSLLIFFHE